MIIYCWFMHPSLGRLSKHVKMSRQLGCPVWRSSFALTASLMQSCSALAASAQPESCISLLPTDTQHASMAVNCAAQGVVGLSVESGKASTENSEKILDAVL